MRHSENKYEYDIISDFLKYSELMTTQVSNPLRVKK